MTQHGQPPGHSRFSHFRAFSCRRSAWAILLPPGSFFSFCRHEHRSARLTDMQQQSLLRGTDCCCRPTWVGTHISALVAVVCSICSAATLLTVLRGVGVSSHPVPVWSAEATRLTVSRGWKVEACRGWTEAPVHACMHATLCGMCGASSALVRAMLEIGHPWITGHQ